MPERKLERLLKRIIDAEPGIDLEVRVTLGLQQEIKKALNIAEKAEKKFYEEQKEKARALGVN